MVGPYITPNPWGVLQFQQVGVRWSVIAQGGNSVRDTTKVDHAWGPFLPKSNHSTLLSKRSFIFNTSEIFSQQVKTMITCGGDLLLIASRDHSDVTQLVP